MPRKKLYGPHEVAHPAPFSSSVIAAVAEMLDGSHRDVLDPFAGIGRVHSLPELVDWPMVTTGVEIEREWAECHPRTREGDACYLTELFAGRDLFDAVVTSPTFGNRFADRGNPQDDSFRRSYTFDLGRKLHINNSGGMQWGRQYRTVHVTVWWQVTQVLRPGGRLVLNISDHIRAKRRRHVTAWHVRELGAHGFRLVDATRVATQRMGFGANRNARVGHELVLAFDLLPDDKEAW